MGKIIASQSHMNAEQFISGAYIMCALALLSAWGLYAFIKNGFEKGFHSDDIIVGIFAIVMTIAFVVGAYALISHSQIQQNEYNIIKQATGKIPDYDLTKDGVLIIAWHEDVEEPNDFEETDICVGVDSGQAGIYDYNHFAHIKDDEKSDERWYDSIQTFAYKRQPVTPVGRYLIDKIKPLHQKRITLRKELESAETELERDLGNRIELELFHQETELMIKGSQYGIQGESLNDYRVSTPVNCIWTDKHSVVTSSGIGDGSYDCYVAKNEAGQIIGIKIDY